MRLPLEIVIFCSTFFIIIYGDGSCSDEDDCDCSPGWSGPKCEVASCDPNPCFHDAKCHGEVVDFHCHCNYAGGQRCQYDDVVPFGWPLQSSRSHLPPITKGYTFIPEQAIHTTDSYLYGLRVVSTGKPTPFNIQIWRREFKNNFTLVYNQRITLSPNVHLHKIRFTDRGISCGLVKDYDRLGLFFPEGANGIGIHKCKKRCGTYINRDASAYIDNETSVEFDWHEMQANFGLQAYFALKGKYGRVLDLNNCPEDTNLPDPLFEDWEEDSSEEMSDFEYKDQDQPEQESDQLTTNCEGERNNPMVILAAALGSLLFISIAIITVPVIRRCCKKSNVTEVPEVPMHAKPPDFPHDLTIPEVSTTGNPNPMYSEPYHEIPMEHNHMIKTDTDLGLYPDYLHAGRVN